MEEFTKLLTEQPLTVVLCIWFLLKAIRELFDHVKWFKERADGYHKKESKKEDFEQKVCDIASTTEKNTKALDHLRKVLENINSDVKGIQEDVVRLKDAHNETLSYMKDQEDKDSIRDRMNLGMARSMLITNYERCVAKGVYTTDEKEVYHELYEAYEQAGGNGIMKDIRERILELPDH